MDLKKLIEISYKKLKHNVYYDKTMAVLRANIALFENDDIEDSLNRIEVALNGENNDWNGFVKEIIDTIDILAMPKSIHEVKNKNFISNFCTSNDVRIDKLQFFIDMDVRGHILGVLWILLLGRYLDNDNTMYHHSYGNRLHKKLFKDNETSYYPCLFETYFSQYKKWRDTGVDIAQKFVNEGNNIIVLSLDFKRFYYSVNFSENEFDEMLLKIIRDNNLREAEHLSRLHKFIYQVIEKYSQKWHSSYSLNESESTNESGNLLPIGFLPSNILANYRLNYFDQHINDRWNPLYYGRYVDDVIIVDKVDKHSLIYEKIFSDKDNISVDEIIRLFMSNCNATKCYKCLDETSRSLFLYKKNEKNELLFYINPVILNSCYDKDNEENQNFKANNGTDIFVQRDKIKVFTFDGNSSDALLKGLKYEINRSASEFRCWPDSAFESTSNDLITLYNVNYDGSINKLNSIEGLSVDGFELSKFLGRQMIISSLVNSKVGTNHEALLKELSPAVLLKNYTVWERIFEILLLHKSIDDLQKIMKKIVDSIVHAKNYNCKDVDVACKDNDCCDARIKDSLLLYLFSCMSRVLALFWRKEISDLVNDIVEYIRKSKIKNYQMSFECVDVMSLRNQFIHSQMINKYLIPLSLSLINVNSFSDEENINLFDFGDICIFIKSKVNKNGGDYFKNLSKFSPTVHSPQEINYTLRTIDLVFGFYRREDHLLKTIINIYRDINFGGCGTETHSIDNVQILSPKDSNEVDWMFAPFIYVGDTEKPQKAKIKVAIANASVDENDLVGLLRQNYNRSFNRYSEMQKILRVAVEENVDMVVLPECYIPYEWLLRLVSWSSKNQIAIVSGVEHLITVNDEDSVITSHNNCIAHNMTAVILPYQFEDYKYSHLVLQHKRYPSPKEEELLRSYGYGFYKPRSFIPVNNVLKINNEEWQRRTYLFCWHNIWFTVHNCFELSSIELRKQHSEYLDLIIAVEWNKDLPYYSGIVESLSRDIHCFCIQVNSSNYGDSRITQPSESALKDIVRTKGGTNFTALTALIDVDSLRSFQLEYGTKNKGLYKPTPPGFNHKNVGLKVNNQLISQKLKRVHDLEERMGKKYDSINIRNSTLKENGRLMLSLNKSYGES